MTFPRNLATLLLAGAATWAFTGCDHHDEEVLAFESQEAGLIAKYASPDVATAEQGLLEYVVLLKDAQSRGLENRDYEYSLAITHARLALLDEYVGRVPESEKQWHEAIYHMTRADRFRGRIARLSEKHRRARLTEIIKGLDQAQKVKWKVLKPKTKGKAKKPAVPAIPAQPVKPAKKPK